MSDQRYSSTGYPPSAPPPAPNRSNTSSPLYAPVLPHPGPPPQLAHARYSSADLYAIQQPPTTDQARGGGGGEVPLIQRSSYRDEDSSGSDSDSDDHGGRGGGFGTYSDFNSLQRPGARNSRRISQAPTLATLPRTTSGFGGGSQYNLKEQTSTITSTTKLDNFDKSSGVGGIGGGAYETVAIPKISRDWDRGEGLDEKNFRKFEKSRRKRQEWKGIFGEYVEKLVKRWKIVLPIFIGFLVALILVLYFCIPRVPSVTFRDSKVPTQLFTSTDPNPFITSTDPVSYYFNANLVLGLDAKKSYVPVHYSSFGITVKLRETGGVIGRTVWDEGEIKVPGKKVTSYEFPIYFSGNYTSISDPTCKFFSLVIFLFPSLSLSHLLTLPMQYSVAVMKASCAHLYPTTYRAPLNLTVEIESKIVGVIGTKTEQVGIANVTCPIQWSGSAN
ncbi:hypothetical protein JCM5350_007630 [Sporobolomyces pararoseus]